jgi:hypothetical protein
MYSITKEVYHRKTKRRSSKAARSQRHKTDTRIHRRTWGNSLQPDDEFIHHIWTEHLNTRLRMLVSFGLVSHQFERTEKRREWYEMTPVGKNYYKGLFSHNKDSFWA